MIDYKKYSWSNTIPFFTVLLMFSILFCYITIPVFFILFILKLLDIIAYSWWIVWLPIYYPIPLCIIGFLLDLLRNWLKKAKN